MLEVSRMLEMDAQSIEEQVSRVVNSEVTYLPVRHHSPGSAVLVKNWIDKNKPKLILIEGPSEANDLIEHIVAKDSRPPLAILSFFVDETNHYNYNGVLSPDPSIPARFQVYYPFISYSPEFIALKEAYKRKIPVYFIDLPLTGIIHTLVKEENPQFMLKQEEVYNISSKFYQKLSQIFEFDNFEETWETLFEIGSNQADIYNLQESRLTYCSCIRQTLNKDLLDADGTLDREEFMKFNIEKYIKKHGVDRKDVLVITGGLHSVVLPETEPKDKNFITEGMLNSLIPYSYYRISEISGYSSGNQGPQFYDDIWQKFNSSIENSFESTSLEVISDILRKARAQGNPVSISDSINAFQGAKLLSMLRRRSEPGLKDVIDSIYMTLVKGNPEVEGKYLEKIIRNRIIGHKVGKITKNLGRLPLQTDFYEQLEVRGIKFSENRQTFSLWLQNQDDLKTSELFWRIKYLGFNILERASGPDVLKGITGKLKETWHLDWSPSIDVKLIEQSSYGSTVEEASKNLLIEEFQKSLGNFETISFLLYQSLTMGFTNQFQKLYNASTDSLEEDNQFLTLASGFINVMMINEQISMMSNQEANISLMEKLVQRSYFSCCFNIPNIANPPQDIQDKVVIAMKNLANILTSLTTIKLDLTVFKESIKTCVENSTNFYIKGSATGVSFLIHDLTTQDIKIVLKDYAQSSNSIKIQMGDFIRGIIFVCQTTILLNPDIIKLLSDIIEGLEWVVFSAILPSLRKAFSELDQREYDVFVEKLSEHHGLKTKKFQEIKEDLEEEVLVFFAEMDKKVRNILLDWFGEV